MRSDWKDRLAVMEMLDAVQSDLQRIQGTLLRLRFAVTAGDISVAAASVTAADDSTTPQSLDDMLAGMKARTDAIVAEMSASSTSTTIQAAAQADNAKHGDSQHDL